MKRRYLYYTLLMRLHRWRIQGGLEAPAYLRPLQNLLINDNTYYRDSNMYDKNEIVINDFASNNKNNRLDFVL